MSPFRDFARVGWLIAGLGIIALILLGYWTITEPGRQREKANTAAASQIVAEGRAAAGADAIDIVTGNAASGAEIDRQSQENRDAILNAPGAAVQVDPGLDAATRRAICMRPSARRSAACVALLDPGAQ